MQYPNHVFISYAHDNNKPVEEGGRGWVEQFQATLDAFLGRRYGKAKIWRDERLRGNDDFAGDICPVSGHRADGGRDLTKLSTVEVVPR